MAIGRILVISGSAVGSLLLTGFLTLLSSLMTMPTAPQPTQELSTALEFTSDNHSSQELDQPNDPGLCRISPLFPADIYRWCDLITLFSNQNELEPDLVAALIWQESGGDPNAYSKSGAVGLMQIMPSDGIAANFQCINGPCFSNRPTSNELYDPEFNIEFGTRMLSRLLNHTGNLREALRSYGPMDVGYTYADKVLNIYQLYKQ